VKVFHVSTVHPNTDNRIVNKYVKGLAHRGYQVVFVCRESAPIESNGFTYIPLLNRTNFLSRIANSWRVLRICWESKNAIFHFHDPELILVGLLLRFRGLSVVYDVHEDNVLAIRQKHYLPKFARGSLARIASLVEAIAARVFKVVIAEKVYSKRFSEALPVLNYPVKSESQPIPRILQTQNLELLYTGSVTTDRGLKNHLNLLKQDSRIKLTIVGSMRPSYLEFVDKFLTVEEITRLTLITDPDSIPFSVIEQHYMSSKYNFGLALFPKSDHYMDKELTKFFEYTKFSLPVLCSNFPLWVELIEGNGVGIALESDDPAYNIALQNRIQDSYADMIENCELFCRQYSWESELSKVESLYHNISSV